MILAKPLLIAPLVVAVLTIMRVTQATIVRGIPSIPIEINRLQLKSMSSYESLNSTLTELTGQRYQKDRELDICNN
jgi:hypothetical protein